MERGGGWGVCTKLCWKNGLGGGGSGNLSVGREEGGKGGYVQPQPKQKKKKARIIGISMYMPASTGSAASAVRPLNIASHAKSCCRAHRNLFFLLGKPGSSCAHALRTGSEEECNLDRQTMGTFKREIEENMIQKIRENPSRSPETNF